MKIIVESERHIGKNPFDFLAKNIIPDGSFVSIGYVNDHEINTGARGQFYITPKNDAELTNIINTIKDNIFKESLIEFQQSAKYQQALMGKRKTAPFDLNGSHLVKISRHIVNWKNPKAFAKFYATRAEAIGDTRVKHGFGDYPEEYDEDDWRNAPEHGGTGRYERSNAKGRQGLPFDPVWDTGFYIYPGATKDDPDSFDKVYLRQIYNRNATKNASMENVWIFVDTEGNYTLLNRQALEWFATAFKRPEIKKVVREIQQEEKDFLKDLSNIKNYDVTECKLILDNILYLTGTTVDDQKNKEPFTWLNDDIIADNFPYLPHDKWEELMHKCIDNSIRFTSDMNENMRVIFKKSYLRKLNESKAIRKRVRSLRRF